MPSPVMGSRSRFLGRVPAWAVLRFDNQNFLIDSAAERLQEQCSG